MALSGMKDLVSAVLEDIASMSVPGVPDKAAAL